MESGVSVRGTSEWRHAKIERLLINMDAGGRPLECVWPECDRRSVSVYQTIAHEHTRNVSCSDVDAGVALGRHYHYTFCSANCKDLWDNATGWHALASIDRTGRAFGNHSPGYRRGRL